ncbi:MAG: cytochrome P450, partial [Glutamicibacter sp.]
MSTAPATCPFTGAQATPGTAPVPHASTESAVREAPVADWVKIEDLYRDPFPIYQRLRAEAPLHWVPAVNRYMVTSYAACHEIEQDEARF